MTKPTHPPICRKLSVAEAIEEERARNRRVRTSKPRRWDTFLQMIGVRKVRV